MIPRRNMAVLSIAALGPLVSVVSRAALPTEADFFAPVPTVTSAARLEKPLLEMGFSVTIIDRETIEASPAIEIPDLLRLVPGFQVAHATGAVFSAGYHGAADQWPRRMEVMVDGRSVYLNTNSTVEWSALGIAKEDIERIEVVRGGNAPTFGSNAVTGSINIVTRPPFLRQGKYLRGTVGSLDTSNAVLSWGGDLGDWETLVTAQYRADDGFDGVNDHKRLTDLRFRGDYQASPSDLWSIQLGLTDGEVGADAREEYFDPIRDREILSHFQQLSWNREGGDGSRFRVNLYHHFYKHDDGFESDISGFPAPPTYTSVFPPGTTLELGIYPATSERYDIEFQHNLAPRDNWRLAWGLGGRFDRLSSDLLLGERDRVDRFSGRAFGSLEWKPRDDLAWTFDFLTEWHESYGSETSPRLGLNWLATEDRSLRASVSRSYRVYTLLERFIDYRLAASDGTPLGTLFVADSLDDFEPEKVTSYEVGYGERWPDLGLYLDVRVFREELEDSGVDLQQPVGPTLWRDAGGDWKTKGFEVQLDYQPSVATRLIAAYSRAWADGRVDSGLDASGLVSEYERIDDSVPAHTFSALLSHRFNPQWSGSLAVYHIDEMRWRGEGSEVDDYTRLDLKLGRELRLGAGKGEVALIVHNLTDEAYNEFRDPEQSSRDGNVFERRLYLQLSMEFD